MLSDHGSSPGARVTALVRAAVFALAMTMAISMPAVAFASGESRQRDYPTPGPAHRVSPGVQAFDELERGSTFDEMLSAEHAAKELRRRLGHRMALVLRKSELAYDSASGRWQLVRPQPYDHRYLFKDLPYLKHAQQTVKAAEATAASESEAKRVAALKRVLREMEYAANSHVNLPFGPDAEPEQLCTALFLGGPLSLVMFTAVADACALGYWVLLPGRAALTTTAPDSAHDDDESPTWFAADRVYRLGRAQVFTDATVGITHDSVSVRRLELVQHVASHNTCADVRACLPPALAVPFQLRNCVHNEGVGLGDCVQIDDSVDNSGAPWLCNTFARSSAERRGREDAVFEAAQEDVRELHRHIDPRYDLDDTGTSGDTHDAAQARNYAQSRRCHFRTGPTLVAATKLPSAAGSAVHRTLQGRQEAAQASTGNGVGADDSKVVLNRLLRVSFGGRVLPVRQAAPAWDTIPPRQFRPVPATRAEANQLLRLAVDVMPAIPTRSGSGSAVAATSPAYDALRSTRLSDRLDAARYPFCPMSRSLSALAFERTRCGNPNSDCAMREGALRKNWLLANAERVAKSAVESPTAYRNDVIVADALPSQGRQWIGERFSTGLLVRQICRAYASRAHAIGGAGVPESPPSSNSSGQERTRTRCTFHFDGWASFAVSEATQRRAVMQTRVWPDTQAYVPLYTAERADLMRRLYAAKAESLIVRGRSPEMLARRAGGVGGADFESVQLYVPTEYFWPLIMPFVQPVVIQSCVATGQPPLTATAPWCGSGYVMTSGGCAAFGVFQDDWYLGASGLSNDGAWFCAGTYDRLTGDDFDNDPAQISASSVCFNPLFAAPSSVLTTMPAEVLRAVARWASNATDPNVEQLRRVVSDTRGWQWPVPNAPYELLRTFRALKPATPVPTTGSLLLAVVRTATKPAPPQSGDNMNMELIAACQPGETLITMGCKSDDQANYGRAWKLIEHKYVSNSDMTQGKCTLGQDYNDKPLFGIVATYICVKFWSPTNQALPTLSVASGPNSGNTATISCAGTTQAVQAFGGMCACWTNRPSGVPQGRLSRSNPVASSTGWSCYSKRDADQGSDPPSVVTAVCGPTPLS